jgi:outer membrane protein assembly factor BamB
VVANTQIDWTATSRGEVDAAPVVDKDRVFFGNRAGTLTAVDLQSGTVDWRFDVDGEIGATPVAMDGAVFVGTVEGTMYAVEQATGTQRWKTEPRSPANTKFTTATSGLVYSMDGFDIHAFDPASGDVRWHIQPERQSRGGLAAGPDRVYYADGQAVYGLAAKTGERQWTADVPNVDSRLTHRDGKIYTGGTRGFVTVIDATSGAVQWRFATETEIQASLAVSAETILVPGDSGLVAINRSEQSERWRTDISNAEPALIGDGVVYVADNKSLITLDLDTGDRLATVTLPSDLDTGRTRTPAATDEGLYVPRGGFVSRVTGTEPTPTPTETPSPTRSPTPTATQTRTPMGTDSPTATRTRTETQSESPTTAAPESTPTATDQDAGTTSAESPGFSVLTAVVSGLGIGAYLRYRDGSTDD